jgi:hypothetical protein
MFKNGFRFGFTLCDGLGQLAGRLIGLVVGGAVGAIAVVVAGLVGTLRALEAMADAEAGELTAVAVFVAGFVAMVAAGLYVEPDTDHSRWWMSAIRILAMALGGGFVGPAAVLAVRAALHIVFRALKSSASDHQAPTDSQLPHQAVASASESDATLDPRLFQRPGEPPRPHLPPKEALACSRERLRRLESLALAPHLSPRRRKVIENLVRAQAAIVVKRMNWIEAVARINTELSTEERSIILSLDRGADPKFEELVAYCRIKGRVAPAPRAWKRLSDVLNDKRWHDGGDRAPRPLILVGWWATDDVAKRQRLLKQLAWARDHGALNDVARVLVGLSDQEWYGTRDSCIGRR